MTTKATSATRSAGVADRVGVVVDSNDVMIAADEEPAEASEVAVASSAVEASSAVDAVLNADGMTTSVVSCRLLLKGSG